MAGQRTRAPGELENAVMRVLWRSEEPMTSVQIRELVDGKKPAQTTLLTALDRLNRKGLVRRVGDSVRGVQFEAAISEAEHASRAMLEALPHDANRSAALLKFAGDLSADDLDLLRAAVSGRQSKRS